MKTKRKIIVFNICALLFIELVSSNDVIAGNYGNKINEITPVFNRAVRNDPPPPKSLDYDYRPKGFDPPGMHGPSVNTYVPPPPPPPRTQIKLTPVFNNSTR